MLAFAAVGIAHADKAIDTDEKSRVVTVPYGDLNLSTSAGLDELKQRIRSAARRVCREDDPRRIGERGVCLRRTEDQALKQIELTASQSESVDVTPAKSKLVCLPPHKPTCYWQ